MVCFLFFVCCDIVMSDEVEFVYLQVVIVVGNLEGTFRYLPRSPFA